MAPADLKVGTCLTRTYREADCSVGHSYEVTALFQDKYAEDPIKAARYRAYACAMHNKNYLGGPYIGTLFIGLPMEQASDPKSDTKRIVCLGMRATDDDSGPALFTGTMKDYIAKHGLGGNTFCTKSEPTSATFTPVSCDSDHTAESVGGTSAGPFEMAYPGDDEMKKKVSATCPAAARNFFGGTLPAELKVSAQYSGQRSWDKGMRSIVCFVEVGSKSKLTKSVYHWGNKPLPLTKS